MKTVRKVAAVLYTKEQNKVYFLIFHRILRWKGWELLKETIEPKESILQAMKRGIREETRFSSYKIIKEIKRQYSWKEDGTNYKIIRAFIVKLPAKKMPNLHQKVQEHSSARWVSKQQAIKMLTYSNAKALLQSINIKSLP